MVTVPEIEAALGNVPLRVPPYRGIAKHLEEARCSEEPVALLVPARTDTRWWWNHVRFGEIRFLRGRVRFDGQRGGAPFPSAVVIFGTGRTSAEWWGPPFSD